MFICLEGAHAAGKTTQCLLLKEKIEKEFGKLVIITKAIDDYNKQIIEKVVADLKLIESPVSFLFLISAFFAKQSFEIKTALENKQIIIADRWKETFNAYNNYFGPLTLEPIITRNIITDLIFSKLDPEISIFIDLSPEIVYKRHKEKIRKKIFTNEVKKTSLDEIELERNHYLNVAKHNKNWIIINGATSIKHVQNEIWRHVYKRLRKNYKNKN